MRLEPGDSRGRLYHIGLKKGDVGKIALLPGDPDRVPRIAERFEESRLISTNREYTTYGGYVDDEFVIAMSTGMGGPAAAIAIEELSRLGVDLMIRVGTCGAISPKSRVGSLIIAEASMRMDGTTRQYVNEGYPASATPEVILALRESASKLKKNYLSGIAASTDAFYAGQGRPSFRNYFPSQSKNLVSDLRAANVLCFDMESSTLFTLGRLFGIRTGGILAVVGDRKRNDFRSDAGIDDAIGVAIDSIRRLKSPSRRLPGRRQSPRNSSQRIRD